MSLLDLEIAKTHLDVIHSADDGKLQLLLDGAEDEAAQFLGLDDIEEIADSEGVLPAAVTIGVLLLLQANYQAAPNDIDVLRRAAEIKMMPYRVGLGV